MTFILFRCHSVIGRSHLIPIIMFVKVSILTSLLTFSIIKCYGLPILNETVFTETRSYSMNGYNLTIKNTALQLNTAVRQHLSELYFQIYPRLVNRFNPKAPRSIQVFIDGQNKYPFWGLAVDSTMIINAYRLRDPSSYPRYYDIFLHELAHLVQQYTTRNLADVKWLGEGLADYVRYTYGGSNVAADWPLPDYSNRQVFNDGYKITARFLIWLEYKYNSSIIDQLDQDLRDVTYKQNKTWKELTGKSIEQLWTDYAKNPDLINDIPFITLTTTVEMTRKSIEIDNVTAVDLQIDEQANLIACVSVESNRKSNHH